MASNLHSPPDDVSDRQVDDAIVRLVSFAIGVEWTDLGRLLLIPNSTLDGVSVQYQLHGVGEMAYQILCIWRETNSANATLSVLTAALERVGRRDLVNQIKALHPNPRAENCFTNRLVELSAEDKEWLKQLRSHLCYKYRNYVMKGLPWMNKNVINLAHYFVDLRVKSHDGNITTTNVIKMKNHSNKRTVYSLEGNVEWQLRKRLGLKEESQHMVVGFQSAFSSHKCPLRILVEGPLGYGKTTMAAKLCFDHAAREDYMKNFDIVLHFPLRSVGGNLEEILCGAAGLTDCHDREMFLKFINNPSIRILLVLDGFDEVPQAHVKPILDLLHGKRFPHVAVVVTSRPGHFTFERWEKENKECAIERDLTFDWNRLWQSRITILGISGMKATFINKHLIEFPESIRSEVSSQLQQLEKSNIIQSDFLKCPLFLLLIILLATDDETGGIRNLRTSTDLYKSVFNFIIRRYGSNQNEPVNEIVDLFAVSEAPKPFYVKLLCQFGDFAFRALTEKKLSFSQEEILGSVEQRDPKILHLGLLTQFDSMEGFTENVTYEPVHKSLLEFSAAYALWLQCPECDRNSWVAKVIHLWRCEGYGRPLWLIMFEGLMRDRFAAFLDALNPYASCSLWEEWLRRSVSEIDLTESILSSLTPFLPTHWKQKREDCFSRTQHDALLLHGVRQGRIKRVTLFEFLATPMPHDVVVDTAVFKRIEDTVVNVHRFNCRHLVFDKSNVFRGLETWIPSTLNFQTLSLGFFWGVSSHHTQLLSSITARPLKDIQIQIGSKIRETAAVVPLTELIKMEKLTALSVSRVPPVKLDFNSLLRAAANSSQLTTLLIEDQGLRAGSIDLCHLYGGVQKTWQFLSIDCNVDFPTQTDQPIQVKCLVLHCPDSSAAVFRFLEVCRMTSLLCRPSVLAHIKTLTLLHEQLTELNVFLDKTAVEAHQCCLPHLPNLTVLIFTITRNVPRSFAARDFLFGSRSFLQLKGIEIWEASENPKLSLEIVKCVSDCLEQCIPFPTCEGRNKLRSSHSLQLEYFLLQSDDIQCFLAPLGEMAVHLRNKFLSRLNIVTREPCSSDWVDLFFPAEGFRVETDVWGSRSEDTILRRMTYDTQYRSLWRLPTRGYCYSIRHVDN